MARALACGAVALFLVAGLTACSPLSVLNGVARPDGWRVTADLAYGVDARQRLDVYVPDGAHDAPVVVFFYGGSWRSGDRADYRFVGDALATRGIVTVVADYRLYPQVRYPDFLNDAAAAVAWTQAHIQAYGGDPGRLVVVGHSAGAYNAAMLALDARWLQRAGSSPQALRGWVGMAGPYNFLPIQSRSLRPVFDAPNTPTDSQPIHHAHAGAPPALLQVGGADTVVDPQLNTEALAQALADAGASVRRVRYDGLGHPMMVGAVARPLRWRAPVLEDLVSFVQERTRASP